MQKYVLGFVFNQDLSRVLLQQKTKPDWQAGKLNGCGGKIQDEYEQPLYAIRRECFEETQLYVHNFKEFGLLKGADYEVYCFAAKFDKDFEYLDGAKIENNGEVLMVFDVDNVFELNVISNLKFLVPMAKLALQNKDDFYTTIEYKKENNEG